MDGARNYLVSCGRLFEEQESRCGWGNNLDLLENFPQSGALAHEILEIVFRLDFGFEIQALVFQAISRCTESSIRERVVQGQRDLCADLGQKVEIFLSEVVRPFTSHANTSKWSVGGREGDNRQRGDRFGLQPFQNCRRKLFDLLLRPDLRGAATYLLKILLGDFTDRNLRKKTLAAGEIEKRTFELVGLFIDEPETGEVIPKVLANRC